MGKTELPACCGKDLSKARRLARNVDGMIVLSAPEGGSWKEPKTFVYWVDSKSSMIRSWETVIPNETRLEGNGQ